MKDFRTHQFEKKNLSTQFREDVTFVIIGCFFLYMFQKFLSFLFSPLQIQSPEEVEERLEEKIADKMNAREERLHRINNDSSDPMYQFLLRFVESPDKYKRDPDNQIYQEWYKEWEKGNVIDSTLRWAPNIFKRGEEMNPVFIEYMKIQLNLHKRASLRKRIQFSNTIHKYYPELSPGLKNLEHDLANYEAEIVGMGMHKALHDEMQKFGLPDEITEYLINLNMEPADLRGTAKIMKNRMEKGVSSELCIFAYENKLKDNLVAAIHLITDQTGLPIRVGYAYFKNELTIEEVKELHNFMLRILESYEGDAFEVIESKGKTAYDDYLDNQLEFYRAKKVLKKD